MKRSRSLAALRLVAGVLAVAWPGASRAQERFEPLIAQAWRLFERREYAQGLELLERLEPLARTRQQRKEFLLCRGSMGAMASRRGQREAVEDYKAAIELDPDASPHVALAPRERKLLDEARARATQARVRPASDAPLMGELDLGTVVDASGSLLAMTLPRGELPGSSRRVSEWMTPRHPYTLAGNPMAEVSRWVASQPRILIPAASGGALVVTGGALWGFAWREQSRLRGDDPGLANLEDATRSASRGKMYQTLGFSLMGVGATMLGVATSLYMLDRSRAEVSSP